MDDLASVLLLDLPPKLIQHTGRLASCTHIDLVPVPHGSEVEREPEEDGDGGEEEGALVARDVRSVERDRRRRRSTRPRSER